MRGRGRSDHKEEIRVTRYEGTQAAIASFGDGEGALSQGTQAASRSKRQGNEFSPRPSRKECSPDDTLILVDF